MSLIPLPDVASDRPPPYVLCLLRDTTGEARVYNRLKALVRDERARAEDLERRVRERTHELEASKRSAEEAARAKTDFLAMMTHELRTPMNAIIGASNCLYNSSAYDHELLDVLDSSSRAMLQLLDDILDFSKIEAKKMNLENVSFDLRGMLGELRGLAELLASDKGLSFELDIKADVPTHVQGDPVRLRQILTNLISNAVKFTAEGKISLLVQPLESMVHGIRFEVLDTGIGIPEGQLDAIFEQFTQAEGSTTRRFGGTGLGLAICKRLTGLMGGTISVSTEMGTGSCFTVDVPLEASSSPSTEQRTQTLKHLEGRVLVVEDNLVNQKIACRLIQNLGVSAEVASNGEAAIEMLSHGAYQVVLMDCHMPGIDGFETTRRIRETTAPWSTVPVVALTANVYRGIEQQCTNAGMNGYISKPIDQHRLHDVLSRWCLPTDETREAS